MWRVPWGNWVAGSLPGFTGVLAEAGVKEHRVQCWAVARWLAVPTRMWV